MDHRETVQQIYAAFGQGDVPAIVSHFAEDIEWEYGPNSTSVPWLQPQQGKENATQFFYSLGQLEFIRFEPKVLLAKGNLVVALIDLESIVKATGRRIVEVDEAHIWYFNDEGKVIRFRHRVDTHQHVEAWEGVAVEASA